MDIILYVILALALAAALYLAIKGRDLRKEIDGLRALLRDQRVRHEKDAKEWAHLTAGLKAENQRLAKYQDIADAETKATELLQTTRATLDAERAQATALTTETTQAAQAALDKANQEAAAVTAEAKQQAKASKDEAKTILESATVQAKQIIDEANIRAEGIAGSAYDAMKNAELYEGTVKAMKNIIEGYGDQYIVPGRSLLDDLAEEFGHTQAGEELKKARERSKAMIRTGTAATCDYVEAQRRDTAINFVVDAFNGKVDSVLSRVRHDNAGTLEQEIRDAFTLVNYNGKAFRTARIMEEYLAARLDELKWAAIAQQLRLEEREEQRRIKEQMREEEKARREYERAMREAARDEEALRKAMEKAQLQVERATDEQKAKYELQLQELTQRLKEAEERSKRALSMAQQTKKGHVYIISNVGSFGEGVYKVGLTRRLEPIDRIKELGDSSVPFDFDVHALMLSDDAPALEYQLHKHFLLMQMNKVDHRKEFFRLDLRHIREEVEKLGLTAKWTMTAEAAEYRESLAIEKAISENPAARDAWVKRQLELSPVGGRPAADAVAAEEEGGESVNEEVMGIRA